jgi:hypothetical protein
MSGVLSQALANLASAEEQIRALGDLPPAAHAVQADALVAIDAVAPTTTALQAAVGGFARDAVLKLAAVQASLAAGAPLPSVKAELLAVQKEAAVLKQTVDNAIGAVTGTGASVSKCSATMAAIEADLNRDAVSLQAQLTTTRRDEAAAKQKYYYLVALGSLGLVGLAAASALYVRTNADLNRLQSKAGMLSHQLSRVRMMRGAADQLGSDFQSVVAKVSCVQSAVGFVGGELGNVITDVDGTEDRVATTIAVQAAITEVSTLATDAS